MGFLNIFLDAAIVNNMVLMYFFGMCSFLAVSKTYKTAFGLGLAVIFVLAVCAPVNWIIYNKVLAPGALVWVHSSLATVDLSFLRLIVFISVIASLVQLVEMVIEKFSPALYVSLGIFLPLITVNCSILGGVLFMFSNEYALGESVVFGLGGGFGFFLAIVAFAAIREKMRYSNVPAPLRGLGMAFIVTGLMGIAFMGFMGIKF